MAGWTASQARQIKTISAAKTIAQTRSTGCRSAICPLSAITRRFSYIDLTGDNDVTWAVDGSCSVYHFCLGQPTHLPLSNATYLILLHLDAARKRVLDSYHPTARALLDAIECMAVTFIVSKEKWI